jgi:ADP-heptose:LPS heptosyltransferase
MHTLVINLTRFGDLLQTQPVFSGLKARGGRVSLACLDSFQGAAALLRDVDGVRALPGARLLARLDSAWPQAVTELSAWLDGGRDDLPDSVLNLTPTLAGRLLGRALHGGELQGFGLDAHGFGQYSTPWAAFLQAASTYRGCSPFNLVDLFQRVAGLDPGEFRLRGPDDVASARAAELLAGAGGQGLVAFQLGASQDYRRWPVAAFVRAGRVLWSRTGRSPVLLGTAAEGHLAREFSDLADYPCTDLTGRTDLPTLAAVLARMDLLLTNDTGTMHLAAGLGVPVAAVFLATAQPFDTGPYLEGSVSLEPDIPCHPCSFGQACPHGLACRESLDGAAVGDLLAARLGGEAGVVPPAFRGRVWQARRDSRGFMDLFSLSGHGGEDRSLWIRIQRDVYRQFLDQREEDGLAPWTGADTGFRRSLEADLRRCAMLLTLVEEQGRLLSLRPGAPIRSKFLANCQNLEDLFAASPALGVLGPLWRYQSKEQSVDMDAFLSLCVRYRGLLGLFGRRIALA